MYAIVETGGKQYRVSEGDVISVERLKAEAGEEVAFDKVLVLGEGGEIRIGTPYVEAAQVFGKVVEHGKGEKVIIFKYKSKKDYRKKQGHRQPYTMIEITGVGTGKAKAPKAEAPKAEAAAAPAEAAAPSLKNMKKDELIAFAKENGIEIDEKATKPVIIEAIEAKLQ
jgi:large subunit ribosomal protein L21